MPPSPCNLPFPPGPAASAAAGRCACYSRGKCVGRQCETVKSLALVRARHIDKTTSLAPWHELARAANGPCARPAPSPRPRPLPS